LALRTDAATDDVHESVPGQVILRDSTRLD
jgi:hypothetical protein